jgi:nitrate ABC transporter ATP-binding subunit
MTAAVLERPAPRPDAPAGAKSQAPVHVSVQGMTKAYETPKGSSIALRDINLEIRRGEFVSLIGHSGCGKSTLLNIIAGLTSATKGQVLIDGKPIQGPGPDRAMVFQNYSLLPWLSVHGNVFEAVDAVYAQKSKSEKHALVDEFLRKVGLAKHRDKKPHQLSGGMKQRVAIARAFAVHPSVLLLDEPFGALDALTKGTMHEELMAMWSGDAQTETVVMVTHDIREAVYLSDRIVVLTNGPAATIGQILDVPIPRPRDKRTIIHDPVWTDTIDRLLYLLETEYHQDV